MHIIGSISILQVNTSLTYTTTHTPTTPHSISVVPLHSYQHGGHVPMDTHLFLCSQPSAGQLTRSRGVGWPLLLQPLRSTPAPPCSPFTTLLPPVPGESIQLDGWLQTGGLGAGMFLWHCRAQIPLSTGAQLNHSSLITVKAALALAPTQL